MRLLIVTWPYALLYWAVCVWAYAPEFTLSRRNPKTRSPQDAASFVVVIVLQSMATFICYGIAFLGRLGVLKHEILWYWIGVGGMFAGSLLRRHCFRMLGKSFTAVVIVTPEQTVIERGAYRWIRHPSYTGGAILLTSQILATGNWAATAIIFVAIAIAYTYRVQVEERALIATLGEPYRAYMLRTKRFIPRIV